MRIVYYFYSRSCEQKWLFDSGFHMPVQVRSGEVELEADMSSLMVSNS